MVLGARRSSIILPTPSTQLQAYASYDPVTRRVVRFIETIVPTLSIDDDVPADIYYADPGANLIPEWFSNVNLASLEHWDATDKRFYALFAGSGGAEPSVSGTIRMAWPTGPLGTAKTFEPKNGEVTKCIFEFRARFSGNADYGVYGVGLISRVATASITFNTVTDHFIQVTRNTGSWELGTCDGATISQQAGGTADGDLHDFRVEWIETEIKLYVDEVLAITKTTNLPTQPLTARVITGSATNTVHLMGIKIRWA